MSNEEIKELLRIFNESGVGELELQRGRDRLRIRRAGETPSGVPFAPMPAPVHEAVHIPAASAPAAPGAQKVGEPDSAHVLVKSPIVGTFYDAPSPGDPPFVKPGD